MKQIKILQTGDLHIGIDFKGLGGLANRRRKDLLTTFTDIVKLALDEEVDLVFITGDLFENWTVSQETLYYIAKELEKLGDILVFIAAGNHDPLTPDSAYFNKTLWSSNVVIFPSEFDSILLDDLEVELWGGSFSAPYAPNSLFKKPKPKNTKYLQLGIIHGEIGTASDYNPISLKDIEYSGLAYLALGHIHKPSGVKKIGNTHYAYAGSPESTGFDELGDHGVLLGTVSQNSQDLKFIPTGQRKYLEISVDVSSAETTHEISTLIMDYLKEHVGEDFEKHLYKIFLQGHITDGFRIDLTQVASLLDSLFFVKLRDRTQIDIDLEQVSKEMSLKGIFVSRILAEMESADNEDARLKLDNALQIGLKAFYGEVKYHGD